MTETNDVGVITTDLLFLKKPCEKVETKEEGEEIAKKLFRTLTADATGVGLAANQISIQKRVCVVNVKEPLYFVNPKYEPVEKDGRFVYLGRCLSMPNLVARTERWRHVIITADNLEANSEIDISNIPDDLLTQNIDAFEMAAIQHEIDHLDGILMIDRTYKPMPVKTEKHYERNDKVTITNGPDSKEIKYKQFHEYVEKGWVIVE